MEDNMHKRVEWRIAQRWRKVRQAYRRAMWAHAHSAMDGSDFYWVQSRWDAVQMERSAVR